MSTIEHWDKREPRHAFTALQSDSINMIAEITELRERVAYLESYIASQKDAMRVTMDELATVRETLLQYKAAKPLTEQVQPVQAPLNKKQIDDIVYRCRCAGDDSTYAIVNAALLQSNAERVPLEPVNCDTCRYHYKDVDQKPCNTCIHSGDFGSNFESRFEITKGQQ